MLVITLPLEGLKAPRDRSASKIVEGLVRFKTERFAYKCVGRDVGLFVSADVGTEVVRKPVSPRNRKMGRSTKNTLRSRTTALRTGCLSSSSHVLQICAASFSNRGETPCASAAKLSAISWFSSSVTLLASSSLQPFTSGRSPFIASLMKSPTGNFKATKCQCSLNDFFTAIKQLTSRYFDRSPSTLALVQMNVRSFCFHCYK